MFTRQNVYELGEDWADPVLWYARGVKAMKARPLDDVTSWSFYGAIHGYLRWLWDLHGITSPDSPEFSYANGLRYVDQCQHQSWFFLPWHRGYLLALERQIRREIEVLGGPHESWALPYWNYFKTGQKTVPPAFTSPDWPDGIGDNPLFVPQRWGVMVNGPEASFEGLIDLNPMGDREFSGPGNGGSTGFGGRPTGFNWSGGDNGGCESQPHNNVHGLVGGGSPTQTIPGTDRALPGLMGVPQTAALDPIFYLHHSNIDRLWASWNANPGGLPAINPNDWRNPTGNDWLDGPEASGDRAFFMPNVDGSPWPYTPREVQDLDEMNNFPNVAALQYVYDDINPGQGPVEDLLVARLETLGRNVPSHLTINRLRRDTNVPQDKTVELMGTGKGKVTIVGSGAQRSVVTLDPPPTERLTRSFAAETSDESQPNRVFLNLENVRAKSDIVLLQVYVGLAEDTKPPFDPKNLAGTVSLFGAGLSSDFNGKHAGNGINHVLEITNILDRLHLSAGITASDLAIDVVPLGEVTADDAVEIGNISLYRQSE